MKVFITCLAMILALTGCVPAVFVAGATAGGSVVYDQRSTREQIRDRNISQVAHNRIAATPSLKNANINIFTYNSVALMVGQVATPEQREEAYQLVSTIPRVTRVYNELAVSHSDGILDTTSDSWITTKVKTALLAEKGLSSSNIKVVTESKVVYLMGLVTPAQGEKAAAVASRITGVKKVVKVFEYEK